MRVSAPAARSVIRSTMSNTGIATTILAQLGGSHRLAAMTGARDFLDCGDALAFRFSARALRNRCLHGWRGTERASRQKKSASN